MIQEKLFAAASGWLVLFALLAVLAGAITLFIIDVATDQQVSLGGLACILTVPVVAFLLAGLFVVNPNQARVLLLFGRYVGTARDPGLRWTNPLYALSGRRAVSLRVRNFETERSKVNDTDGNPIEIAAVVVWKVVDTAEAVIRGGRLHQLRARPERVGGPQSRHTLRVRRARGGAVLAARQYGGDRRCSCRPRSRAGSTRPGSRCSKPASRFLAYAPEIASAMLQRQQAGAIIAARSRIVDGAVGMVQMALDSLSSRNIVELDEERKAAMVSNLLVVLCGDKATQPVVNTGTLHQ